MGRWGIRRSVVFQNLTPGRYKFRVIGDNGFGVWNTVGAVFEFSVVPPFWNRTWFGVLILMAMTTITAAMYHWRLRRIKKAHALQENFSKLLIESQEKERQRIAAELHDGLGQSLLIIKNRAFLALQALGDAEIAGEQLDEISSTATEAINDVRAVSYDLHPYQLDRFGLTRSLRGMCQQASEISGITFSAELDDIDGLLAKVAERSVFRIVQELISNVMRHSEASRAELSIAKEQSELLINMHDDGRGFARSPGSSKDERTGFGLIGIAERVRMLRGSHNLTSHPGQGTWVSIRIPV